MKKKSNYGLYQFLEIRFADPVTSIGLGEKFIIFGTIMGKIVAFSVADKQTFLISEISKENITGIYFDSPEIFTISIGDEEYVKYRLDVDETGHLFPTSMRFCNYPNELTHKNACDTSFTFLSSQNLMITNMNMPNETNLNIEETTTNIKVL
jgi:hypothetical protein